MRLFSFLLTMFFSVQALAFSAEDLRAFGKSAPVQFYLFTSLTCSHCADFHKNILPTLKKEYANTGKAQIIIVDTIRDGASLMATQIVRCLDTEHANKLENDLYAHQSKWMKKDLDDLKRALFNYAAKQGMSKTKFDQCIADKKLQNSIIEQHQNLSTLYDISGTPALVMREGMEVRKWLGANKQIFQELKEAFQK